MASALHCSRGGARNKNPECAGASLPSSSSSSKEGCITSHGFTCASSPVARRSLLVARRSSLVARRSSLVARRLKAVAHRPSLVACRLSLVARRSSPLVSSLVASRFSIVRCAMCDVRCAMCAACVTNAPPARVVSLFSSPCHFYAQLLFCLIMYVCAPSGLGFRV